MLFLVVDDDVGDVHVANVEGTWGEWPVKRVAQWPAVEGDGTADDVADVLLVEVGLELFALDLVLSLLNGWLLDSTVDTTVNSAVDSLSLLSLNSTVNSLDSLSVKSTVLDTLDTLLDALVFTTDILSLDSLDSTADDSLLSLETLSLVNWVSLLLSLVYVLSGDVLLLATVWYLSSYLSSNLSNLSYLSNVLLLSGVLSLVNMTVLVDLALVALSLLSAIDVVPVLWVWVWVLPWGDLVKVTTLPFASLVDGNSSVVVWQDFDGLVATRDLWSLSVNVLLVVLWLNDLVLLGLVGLVLLWDDWSVGNVLLANWATDDDEQLEWVSVNLSLGEGQPSWVSVDLLWLSDPEWVLRVDGSVDSVLDLLD